MSIEYVCDGLEEVDDAGAGTGVLCKRSSQDVA